MKSLTVLTVAAFVAALVQQPARAAIILHDTWADGDRTSSGADGSGIDSPWYSSTGTSLNVSPGTMSASIAASSSLTFWTYFEPAGTPVALANIGDSLKVTLQFNVAGVAAQNTSRAFNFGLFDYDPNGTRRTSDGGSPGGAGVTGYRQAMNFGSSFGVVNALQTQQRTAVGDANLLSTSGDYATVGSNGGGNAVGAPGIANGTTYTLTFQVARSGANSLDLTTTITDGNALNLTQTVTDSGSPTFSFDTLAFRPTTGGNTASTINFADLKIETLSAVPEPSIAAFGALGILGALKLRRRS